MQPLLPESQRAGMTADFLLDWLVDHLPLHLREASEAREHLRTQQMVDVTAVLPVFTSMFQVRVQVFQHARPHGDPGAQETIQPSPVQGPAVGADGSPTPVLRLYWRGDHFEPVFPTAGDRVAVAGGLGEGPPAVAAAWQAARQLRLALEQVREMLGRPRAGAVLDEAAAQGFLDRAEAVERAGGRIAVSVTAQTSQAVIDSLRAHVTQIDTLTGDLRQRLGEPVLPVAAAPPAAPGSSRQVAQQYADQHLRELPPGLTRAGAVTALEAVLEEAAAQHDEEFRDLRNGLVSRGLQMLPPARGLDTAHARQLLGVDAGQIGRVFTVASAVTGRAGPAEAPAATLFVFQQPQAIDLSGLPGQEGTVMFPPGTRFEVVDALTVVDELTEEEHQTIWLRHAPERGAPAG